MKARKVKGLDSAGPLGDNAERIVRTRLAELTSFMPTAADPAEVVALHDMRIAAKRLRYVLEVTGPVFGPYAGTAVKRTKKLQDLLGEIHDCDVQLPEVAELGPAALQEHLRARRAERFQDFLSLWDEYRREGFAPALAYAVSERSHSSQ